MIVVRYLRSRMRSASIGCPEMGLNTLICSVNSDWTFSGFIAGREGVVSAAQ